MTRRLASFSAICFSRAKVICISTVIGLMMSRSEPLKRGPLVRTLDEKPIRFDLVRYREWFLDQFTLQVDGAEPVSFAEYRGREDSPQAPDAASSEADDLPARRR